MRSPDEPPLYILRLSEEARRQIDAEIVRLYDTSDENVARAWRDGLDTALTGLATLPARCPTAHEDVLYQHGTLRQLLYQRRRSGPAWRILFTVHEANEYDPPTVRVHQIRHAAQPPLTDWPSDEDSEP